MSGQKREKKTLPFPVDDHRLVDPGQSLTELTLADEEFVPLAFLNDEDKAVIAGGIYPAGSSSGRKWCSLFSSAYENSQTSLK